jgi:hemoglobin/transferrin/lactoferrin receptor protein
MSPTRVGGLAALVLWSVHAPVSRAQDPPSRAETRPGGESRPAAGQEAFERARDQAIDDVETIVITATRTPRPILTAPTSVYTKTADQIVFDDLARTLVDSMRFTPGVMVQKTSYGQSSPFLRGLTGYHTLLMMDGIRLNDSVLRAGPNDLWSTVDPHALSGYELVLGTSSVLYGSDSMGGTLNALPRARTDYSRRWDFDGRALVRYSSAENAFLYRAEAEGNVCDTFGFALGATENELDDLRAGGDVGEQPHTGYGMHAADATFDFKVAPKWRLRLLGQAVSLDDVRRTHQTIYGVPYHGTTVGTDRRRTLDFERELAAITLDGADLCGGVDRARFQISYQHYGEDQDRIRSNGTRNQDVLDVHTLGLVANASSKTAIGYLTWGVDYYHDRVDSSRRNFDAMGTFTGRGIQGVVADDSTYDLLGVFVQDEYTISRCWALVGGARFTYAAVDAGHVADPMLGDVSIDDGWANVIGSARAIYRPTSTSTIYGGVAQGYRTPNLSDLTRLDVARTNELEVPSPGLDPESSINFEIGARLEGPLSFEAAYFYNILQDFIVRRPTGLVAPGGEDIVVKDNAGDGHVQGVDVAAGWRIDEHWSVRVTGTWQDGQLEGYPTSAPDKKTEPLSRLSPLAGTAQVRWQTADERFWVEGRMLVNGHQERLSSSDLRDTQRIPPGGSPGFTVFGIHAGAKVTDRVTVFGGIDNLFDKNYRIHGSGVQEPGFNAILGVEVRF